MFDLCTCCAAGGEAAVRLVVPQAEQRASTTAACVVEPGMDIQQYIDAAARGGAGGGDGGSNKCVLKRGVHNISKPIVLPSNFGAPESACNCIVASYPPLLIDCCVALPAARVQRSLARGPA